LTGLGLVALYFGEASYRAHSYCKAEVSRNLTNSTLWRVCGIAGRKVSVSSAVALVLTLGSCRETREKRVTAFVERCSAAKFEPEQCVFLLSILDAANDASDDAATATALAASQTAIHAVTRQ
jgi:hypothetical protein